MVKLVKIGVVDIKSGIWKAIAQIAQLAELTTAYRRSNAGLDQKRVVYASSDLFPISRRVKDKTELRGAFICGRSPASGVTCQMNSVDLPKPFCGVPLKEISSLVVAPGSRSANLEPYRAIPLSHKRQDGHAF